MIRGEDAGPGEPAYARPVVERAYEAEITLRFRVKGEDEPGADALAERFAWGAAAWVDASGFPPWTRWTMVTGTDVDQVEVDASTSGLSVVTEETVDEALGQ